MKKTLGCLVLFALAAAPGWAKVTIDYAGDYPFEQVKTFAYVENQQTPGPDDLMDQRIKDGIIQRLKASGLQQVESDPDIYVTYHVTAEQNTVYHTTSYGYGGWGPGWHSWGAVGVGGATTTASTYTEGTLIVDAYEPTDKKIVWRGTGTVTVKNKPEKRARQIDMILTEMSEKWKKILAKQGE
jgi:hypothetical protein